jgi:hypothetical protein
MATKRTATHPAEAREARMRPLAQLIQGKPPVVSVGPDDTVLTALALLAQHDI